MRARIAEEQDRGQKLDAERFDLKTEATLRRNGKVVLTASTDETGAYINVPGESLSLPSDVMRAALERAGILYPPGVLGVAAGRYQG